MTYRRLMLGVVPTQGETIARLHKEKKQRICALDLLSLTLFAYKLEVLQGVGGHSFFISFSAPLLLLKTTLAFASTLSLSRTSAQCFGKQEELLSIGKGDANGRNGLAKWRKLYLRYGVDAYLRPVVWEYLCSEVSTSSFDVMMLRKLAARRRTLKRNTNINRKVSQTKMR